ncbi:MAG TPA: hypothetical protein PLM25_10195 [Limnochordia bacterium]|nr:hypothetical protein [Limnochordia bacterium]
MTLRKGMVLVTVQLLVYPVLLLLVAGFVLLTVPRDHLRVLLPYGAVLGGILDYLTSLATGVLGLTSFKNLGILQAGDHPLLGHLVWVFLIVFFLYYWPSENRGLGYLYTAAWALLATGFSQVVKQAEIFEYVPWYYPVPMFLLFLARFALAVWVAQRQGVLR